MDSLVVIQLPWLALVSPGVGVLMPEQLTLLPGRELAAESCSARLNDSWHLYLGEDTEHYTNVAQNCVKIIGCRY